MEGSVGIFGVTLQGFCVFASLSCLAKLHSFGWDLKDLLEVRYQNCPCLFLKTDGVKSGAWACNRV